MNNGSIHVVTPTPRLLALRALRIAGGYADAHILEQGHNRGDQVEFFQHLMGGHAGDPWCADFVSACLVKAYAQLTWKPESRSDLPHYVDAVRSLYLGVSASCIGLYQSAVSRQMFRTAGFVPSSGDLVLFDFALTGDPHHVEFVDVWPHTIGGNTSGGDGGNQGEGDGVFRRMRDSRHVFGFIHFASA